MQEIEQRFSLEHGQSDLLVASELISWGPWESVIDVTFGPNGDASMEKNGWVFRIRRRGETSKLEFKSRIGSSHWWEATATTDGMASWLKAFELMGLHPGWLIERQRCISQFLGCELALDRVALLGDFLEIEGEVERIEAAATALGRQIGIRLGGQAPAYGDLLRTTLASSSALRAEHAEHLSRALVELADRDHAEGADALAVDVHRATMNRDASYAAYSSHPVGAIVRLSDGSVFDGSSVENGSAGLTLCAERAAVAAAVQAGFVNTEGLEISRVVIVGPDGRDCPPCGACRQVLLELAPTADVVFYEGRDFVHASVKDLMPHPYSL